jgi:RNA polymerase sigma-70 factor (ECF subfamily)
MQERLAAEVTEAGGEPEDEEVVRRVKEGELGQFEVLMRRYNQRVYRVVRAILRSDDEAVDVMQAAYLSALTHIGGFAGAARVSTWITRIAVHEALGRVRERSRIELLGDADEDSMMATPEPGPEDRVGSGELRKFLENAVDELPEVFRSTFVLRSIENLSVAETAEILGIPEETVKTRMHRARERLRTSLPIKSAKSYPGCSDFIARAATKWFTSCSRVSFSRLARRQT